MDSNVKGGRHDLVKAVRLVAYARGREQTMARLEDLEYVAREWRKALNVAPGRAAQIERVRDQEFAREAA